MIYKSTDTIHECLGQHCSAKTMPELPCAWLNQGPVASIGGTPGSTIRTLSCATSKPIWYTVHAVLVTPDWPNITKVAGPISAQFYSHYAPVGGSRLRDVYLCELDNYVGCTNVTLLGKSAATNIAIAAYTTYTISIYNTSGTLGTYAALPTGSGTTTLAFMFTLSGDAIIGYSVSTKFLGDIVLPYLPATAARITLGTHHNQNKEILAA